MGGTRLYFEYKEQNKWSSWKAYISTWAQFNSFLQYSVTCNRKKAPSNNNIFHDLVYKLVTSTCSKNLYKPDTLFFSPIRKLFSVNDHKSKFKTRLSFHSTFQVHCTASAILRASAQLPVMLQHLQIFTSLKVRYFL